MRVALCPDEGAYERNGGCALKEVEAADGVVHLVYQGLRPGRYAIKAFHDIDRNGSLTTNWFGIPVEPYGFGNNARRPTGPPSFEGASFRVELGTNTHRITLE